MSVKVNSKFTIAYSDNDIVILIDHDNGASVTNDAENVILWLVEHFGGSLSGRNVYYRDTTGVYDQLNHQNNIFTGFSACPPHIRVALSGLVANSQGIV